MEYEIIWSINASREMRRLDRSVAKRIYSKVDQLKENPERLLERLVNSQYYRLRVGDYKIILDIQTKIDFYMDHNQSNAFPTLGR